MSDKPIDCLEQVDPPAEEDPNAFRKELEALLNTRSKENGSNTPDFILAEYLLSCLEAFDKAVNTRSWWWRGTDSGKTVPGRPDTVEDVAMNMDELVTDG